MNQPANSLIIANMGGCGNNWVGYVFSKIAGVSFVSASVPGLSYEDYKTKIHNDPILKKTHEQNVRYRMYGPIDCLLDEMALVFPDSRLHVISHYYSAALIASSRGKYPPQIPHKIMYTYGCPLKRFRATFKGIEQAIRLKSWDIPAWVADFKLHHPECAGLIAATEQHFGKKLTDEQVAASASNLYATLEVIKDLDRAEIMDLRLVNFEELRLSESLLKNIVAWASDDRLSVDDELIADIYARSETLGTSRDWKKVALAPIEDNIEAMYQAPYTSQAIWGTMNAWQRFFFQECMKLLPFDYIEFYKENGIDLSFIRQS